MEFISLVAPFSSCFGIKGGKPVAFDNVVSLHRTNDYGLLHQHSLCSATSWVGRPQRAR